MLLLYCIIFFSSRHPPQGYWVRDGCGCQHLRESASTVIRERQENRRSYIVLLLASATVVMICTAGKYVISHYIFIWLFCFIHCELSLIHGGSLMWTVEFRKTYMLFHCPLTMLKYILWEWKIGAALYILIPCLSSASFIYTFDEPFSWLHFSIFNIFSGELDISYLFVKDKPIEWGFEKYTWYFSLKYGLGAVALLGILPLCSKVPDTILALIGLVSKACGLVVLGIAWEDTAVFVGKILFVYPSYGNYCQGCFNTFTGSLCWLKWVKTKSDWNS